MSARLPAVEDIRARVREVTTRVRARAQSLRAGSRGESATATAPLLESILGEAKLPAVERVRTRIEEVRTRIRTRGLLGGGMMEIFSPGAFRPFSVEERKEVRPRPTIKGYRPFSV